jgi:hypothetical protein
MTLTSATKTCCVHSYCEHIPRCSGQKKKKEVFIRTIKSVNLELPSKLIGQRTQQWPKIYCPFKILQKVSWSSTFVDHNENCTSSSRLVIKVT